MYLFFCFHCIAFLVENLCYLNLCLFRKSRETEIKKLSETQIHFNVHTLKKQDSYSLVQAFQPSATKQTNYNDSFPLCSQRKELR